MTTYGKYFAAAVIVILGALIYGAYQYPKYEAAAIGGSPSGTTFGTAKVAEIVMVPTSNTATSSSILNTDATDRFVLDSFVSCATSSNAVFGPAGGVATWQWTIATTSSSAPAVITNSNNVALINVSTSTTDNEFAASSTPPAAVRNRNWPSGSYLTFAPNATSSNQTISCQAGVHYIGS